MARTVNFDAVLRIGGAITSSFTNVLKGTRVAMDTVTKSIRDAEKEQRSLAREMAKMARNGPAQVGAQVTRYQQLQRAIDGAKHAQEQLNKASARRDRINAVAGGVQAVGSAASSSGRSILRTAVPVVGAAISRENEINIIKNTGLSSADQSVLLSAAGASKQFGVSQTEAFHTARELYASLGSAHHAAEVLGEALKAQSGLQLYNRGHAGSEIGGDAMYSLAKIADERGGATSPERMKEEMDKAFRAVTASQGVLSMSDWLVAQRGAKAAGVGATSDAFYGDAAMVQNLSPAGYGKALSTLNNAWIGGHQDGHKFFNMAKDGLVDKSKVKVKNGMVHKYTSDALVDNKLFIQDQQAWVEKHLLPLAKKKGINLADSAAVQKFVSDYTSNTNAGNILFQRLFNMVAIDRERKNYLTAPGMVASDKANQASSAGKIDDVKARYDDAKVEMGKSLTPTINSVLPMATRAMETFNGFAKEHNTLVGGAVLGVTALGGALTVVGPILGVAATGMNLYAAAQMRSASASIAAGFQATQSGNAIGGAATGASRSMLGAVGGALKWAGAIGLIAAAVFSVYENWDMLKRTGMKLWDGTKEGAETVYNWAAGKVGGGDNAWAKTQAYLGNDEALKIQASKDRLAAAGGSKQHLPDFAKANAGAFSPPGDHRTQTFNITQLPGESGDAFAKRVANTPGSPTAPKSSSAMHDH